MPARKIPGSLNWTCTVSPLTRASSNTTFVGSRTWMFADEEMEVGSCPLSPMRICSCGIAMTPRLADGAKIGPTRIWLCASNSGCSGAPARRSSGATL